MIVIMIQTIIIKKTNQRIKSLAPYAEGFFILILRPRNGT
jgi:hypothetical protein